MFKMDWEKTSATNRFPTDTIKKMVQIVYPDKEISSLSLIEGGCANHNYKIQFTEDNSPKLLRFYLRDKNAAYREEKLGRSLKNKLPIPVTQMIGEMEDYRYAIMDFMSGITLRDLLLSSTPCDFSSIMFDVGVTLSKISSQKFSKRGFFDNELNIIAPSPADDYLRFGKESLQDQTILSVLTSESIIKIKNALDQSTELLPNSNQACLVHGDFDPANILVDKVDKQWQVSAVLDWEFAFSGSMLWDVANMLRYAHKMPAYYQGSFLDGLTYSGLTLPENWLATTHLLNLLSLLDCLKRSNLYMHPNRCADIRELIDHILSKLYA